MDIETFLEKKSELAKLLKDNGQEMLRTLFASLFADQPDIKTVTWLQYTPYFNDGDACTFSVHEPHFATAYPEDISGFSGYGSDGDEDAAWLATYGDSARPALRAFEKRFHAAKVVLESLGDHAHVTVTNREDGIRFDVEEHSHD